MPVVNVRIVRMFMLCRRVMMPMAVGLAGRVVGAMGMLMVCVMDMAMFMVEFFVLMPMNMTFGQVQIEPDAHQAGGKQ